MSGGWPPALEDRYTLLRPLSDGVMARVFAAHDRKHARDVAVKILRLDASHDGLASRFSQEVRIAAQLNHPHILPLFDSGEVDGAPYFVMPLVGGMTLRRRLEDEGTLPLAVALSIARQVAAALDYAHQHGVVHRDIKPENILLDGRDARVTDFGIAAAVGTPREERITQAGTVVGTPRYMSPEQASGETTIDGRADLYALGVVLYEMLTGTAPYPSVFAAAAEGVVETPSVRALRPDVPIDVASAIENAIALDPAERTPTARAFIDALSAAGVPPATTQGGTPAAARARVPLRRPAMGIVAGLAIIALAIAGVRWTRAPTADLPHPRRWILVADFDAEPGDRTNAIAMRELALTGLSQSPDFSLVPREHLITARQNAGIADTLPVFGARARELAMRSTVRVVVEGSIRRLGANRWALTMRAVNAEDGSVLFAASADASDASLVRDVDGLVRRVRAGLGERAEALEVTQPLHEVSTASFPAFLHYQNAISLARRADYEGAVHLAHQAIALDSSFASAWVMLANNYLSLQRTDSAVWAFNRARELPERLGEAERDRVEAEIAFYVEHEPEPALRAYDRYLARHPESVGVRNNRALVLSALGRHAEALDAFRAAIRVDPLLVGPRNIQLLNMATELVVIGAIDSAVVTARPLAGAHSQYVTMLRLNALSLWDSLAVVSRQILDAPAPSRFVAFPAVLHEAGSLEALGRSAEVDARFAAAMSRAKESDLRWLSHARLLLDAARGESPQWRLATEIGTANNGPACLLRGLHAAQRGALKEAEPALRSLKALPERERRALGAGVAYLEAWMALQSGDAQRAYELVREPAARGEHHPFSVDRVGTIPLRLLEARALAALGRAEDASAALARAQQATGLAPNHFPLRGLAARAVVPRSGGQ